MGMWIEWQGGECPVAKGTMVEVRHRDGDEIVDVAGVRGSAAHDWSRDEEEHDGDIMAYRVVQA